MPTRYLKAVFSDGHVARRASPPTSMRFYTHAWRAAGTYDYPKEGRVEFKGGGFSQSADQCARNLEAETAWVRDKSPVWTCREVVAVVEIEGKEYRALKS